MFIWAALNENAKQAKILWTITGICLNPEKSEVNISSWSYDMEGHAKKCMERYCELANKTTQLHIVATPCLDDHQFKEEEEMGSFGELS